MENKGDGVLNNVSGIEPEGGGGGEGGRAEVEGGNLSQRTPCFDPQRWTVRQEVASQRLTRGEEMR